MVYNGYYKVMSNIPKMGQLPTPDSYRAHRTGLGPSAMPLDSSVGRSPGSQSLTWEATQWVKRSVLDGETNGNLGKP